MQQTASPEDLAIRLQHWHQLIDPVEGWLNPVAGEGLYQLVGFYAPVPVVVELGSWMGRSTLWLAAGLADRGGGRCVAVDTWMGTPSEGVHAKRLEEIGGSEQLFATFMANCQRAGVTAIVEPWRLTTTEAARRWSEAVPIGLLYIDADHGYEAVRRDFECWSPWMAAGGIVVFDDVPTWSGPSQVAWELPRWYQWLGFGPNQVYFRRR
jgi:predicted O-methyltransferase YrrM